MIVKKIFVFVLCIFLAGCTVIKENTEKVIEIKPSPQIIEPGDSNRYLRVNLYFLNEDEKKLVIDLRTILLQKDENPAETVIRELIRGPQIQGQNRVLTQGVTLDHVEVGDDVADIYMRSGNKKLPDEEKFIFKIAAANTLIDLLDITYVNVFWDGMQKSPNQLPVGPQIKTNDAVEVAWNREREERAAQSNRAAYDGRVILYFAAKDNPFIVPEVRNISFSSENGVAALIDELIKGPKDTAGKNGLFSKQTQFLNADLILENNVKTLVLNFEKLLRPSKPADEMLCYASLVYTLTGILTDVETIKIDIQGKTVLNVGTKKFENGMRRSDFSEMVGKSIPLYMMYKDSTLLTGINRTVKQSNQWDAWLRLKELFAGPNENDNPYALPVLPADIEENDILGVMLNNDTAIVNLSGNFKNKCAGLSEENETILVFGIVNTLTEMKGIKQVLFQVEGKPVEKLAGHLYLSTLLIRNPGIIKKTL